MRGEKGRIPVILNLGTNVNECSASRPSRLTLTEKVSDSEGTGGCVGTRCGFGVLEKRRSLALAGTYIYIYIIYNCRHIPFTCVHTYIYTHTHMGLNQQTEPNTTIH